jgi:hypothetical protein
MARLNARYYRAEQAPQSSQEDEVNWRWVNEPEQVVVSVENPNPKEEPPKTGPQTQPQLIDINPVTGEPSTDITFCARHPKVETGLRCVKCNTPICSRCMVYSSAGLRCPNCAPQTSSKVSADYTQQKNASFAKQPPRDTGFRTYWRRTSPVYVLQPQHYLLAGLAAAGAALLGGVIWGFLLNADQASSGAVGRAFVNSVHLLPEIIMGVLVGEAVARATRDSRGRGLQIIASLGVFFGYLVALATLIVRATNIRVPGAGIPPLGDLLDVTWRTFNGLFSGSTAISLLLFFGLGIVIAWLRLSNR